MSVHSRLALTCAAVLSVPLLAASTSVAAQPSTPRPSTPRTGFELRGGASWTTQEEEQRFLAALDRGSERLAVIRIGTTPQGRPLQLVTVADPAPAGPERVAAGSSILFVCSQHGDEPSGREACLQLARDLAYDDSADTRALLRHTTVLFVPTANPDGYAAHTRENAAGVDVNRDHLALVSPEARAIARVIRDYKPDLVHDLHEYTPRRRVYDRQLIHLWPRNRNVDAGVYQLSKELNDLVDRNVARAGYSTGVYGIYHGPHGEPIAQSAGDGQERILRNMAGLRHALGILVEANNEPTNPREAADPATLNRRRVRTHLEAGRASLELFRRKGAEIARATAAAEREAARQGATGDTPLYFGGADNVLPAPAEVTVEPPCGYRLTAQQYARVAGVLELHGITATPYHERRPSAEPEGEGRARA